MNEEKRSFYENEAFLTWQTVKENYPKATHMDSVSDNTELRVFLSVQGKQDPTVEFINFSVDDSGNCIDAAYILKNPFDLNFYGLSDEEMLSAWDHYGCADFIDAGYPFDPLRSKMYDLLLVDFGPVVITNVENKS